MLKNSKTDKYALYLVPDVSNSNSLLTGVSFYLHERPIFTVGGAEFSSDVFEPFRPFGTIKHYVDGVFFFLFRFLLIYRFFLSLFLSPVPYHTHYRLHTSIFCCRRLYAG